jgi:serine/threonine protein kinase
MSLTVGTIISHYRIESRLGAGGMGEVYKAYDTLLERPVALKILTAELLESEDRVRRFVQEAKAASALNHPHIVTIYEIGETEADVGREGERQPSNGNPGNGAHGPEGARPVHYIAMEFINGDTLRVKIHRERADLKRLLEMLAQVADGLAKAHAAGIVHRDLKPENVMITEDGYAKVVDFGLAKLIEPRKPVAPDDILEAETVMMGRTQPGIVMGTIGYMSPEQVQGKAVDQRSDIFSFGCILYEAATGQKPFAGESMIDSLHRIVYAQAPPIAEFNPDTPAELQRIIRKCLSKDPEERYQSIRDVTIDLRDLIKEYDSQPSVSALYYQLGPGPPARAAAGRSPARKSRAGLLAALACGAVVIALAAFALFKLTARDEGPAASGAPFQNIRVTSLTSTGRSSGAAISPDGKYVVHVVSEVGLQSLWVRQVATSSNIQIMPPADVGYKVPTFSHDGNYVYYVRQEKNNVVSMLYQIPVLGGTPKKILEDIDSSISISPDGSRFVFMRMVPSLRESQLLIANIDGTGERVLSRRNRPDFYSVPAWSPDGKLVACSVGGNTDGALGVQMNVVEVNVEDGAERPITRDKWDNIGRLAWLKDGSGLIMIAVDQTSKSGQIWHLSYPGGEARRITNDLNNYSSLSLTADSSSLVVVQSDRLSSIWVLPGGNAARARLVSSGMSKYSGISWTPDGRVVYGTAASNATDIWIMGADGSGQGRLTVDHGMNLFPCVSPDGRYIVFSSNRATAPTAFNIWRMDIDGSNPKQLTSGSRDFHPTCSPDGKWVVYNSYASGQEIIWKVPMDGGEPVRLTDKTSALPAVSPDGRQIACIYWDEQLTSQMGISIIPAEGGEPVKTFEIPPGRTRWSADGRALMYVDNSGGVSNIWSIPVSSGKPSRLTDFGSDLIFDFDRSRDGRQLACVRGVVTSDVVLMTNLK